MATFDDKLLGEKLQYYISESESEEEEVKDEGSSEMNLNQSHWTGTSVNTGPKGVVEDWQKFKQMQAEIREENEKQRIELAKKLSLTVSSYKDDLKRQQEDLEKEMAELMDDDILLQFQKKRLMEMMIASGTNAKHFGKVFNISTPAEFLDCVENENKHILVLVHVYDNSITACKEVNKSLETLAPKHKNVKFCKILWSTTGMSHNFQENGLPAILVYKSGVLIGNFVQITKELGDDFFPSDLESYLIEKDILVEI